MNNSSQKRLWEILPGALTWSAILLPIILSFFAPVPVVIFILLFDLYWVYKSFIMGIHLVTGYQIMQSQLRIAWQERLKNLQPSALTPDWKKIYQVVILATYKEERETLEPSVQSIIESNFPKERLIIFLATEARDRPRAYQLGQYLKNHYQPKIYDFVVTEHPVIAGEVKGKGANVTWAARKLSQYVRSHNINPENVIVTTADADTRFHPKFFDCLAYQFLTCPNRQRRSFQPVPIYANNIWQATLFARILAFGSSFWQIIESTRPWRLINFSTHSMSLKTLEEMDYWDRFVVNEDSRQFWRAYFQFRGDHQVIPLFFPIYMDAVLAHNIWQTVKNQYQQRLRWAYGIEHAPLVLSHFFQKDNISFLDKFLKTFRFLENNFSWATASIFIAILGWLPLLLNPDFHSTVLAFNVRFYASRLLGIAWVGLLVSAVISMKLLPPRPKGIRKIKSVAMFAQWIFIPIVAILFSSIPAIDAQTRLMLGRYLTFVVTKKEVAKG